MELGLREWLIIIGLIVIAAILFDGWRRIRGSRGKLRLDRNLNQYYDNDETKTKFSPSPVFNDDKEVMEDAFPLSSKEINTAHKAKKQEPQISLNLADEVASASNNINSNEQETESKPLPIEKVLIINVVAQDKDGFKGPALLQNILESGLRFGEMDIFHRHESMTGNGERYFSMANGVKPGTFDLDDIDHFSTRAVSFFLGLPGPKHPKRAFDVMLAAARKLANELNGELLDDQHSVMTAQTIEHYRQSIVDFERRKLKKRY
ncbi:cell division protein ZipA [Entomomonas moraniae]|uniref:Cell division protein ZipA n=1 Tax=Entomomonas moraniae TaxID=2213226 RepID=A0A3Q9JMF5_9GAMM|nr:cell division protein ZipA [Entomomonas moraniae]AZS49418.1 cell division protein ZipA [Entomomonas moraniae]